MGELVRVDLDLLPAEDAYRPHGRGAWYLRKVPTGLGVGVLFGLASVVFNTWAIGLGMATVFAWSIVRRRRLVKLFQQNDDALALYAGGELDAAGPAFDGLCRAARGAPGLHSLLVYNRAAVFLDAGEPDRAAALLSAVLHAGWIGPSGTLTAYYPSALGRLAIAEALRGRLDQAQAWRTRAHAATSAARRGVHLLMDVIIEAKLGGFDSALSAIEEGWARAENMLTARQLRAVRLIEAFALERSASSDYRGVSRETDLVRALEAARRGGAAEFGYLTAHWDELSAFAQRHKLSGSAA